MRLKLLIVSCLFFAACPKPQIIVVPSDHEIKEIPGEPGWYKISAGHLQELYDQQLDLVHELEQCNQEVQAK